MLQISLLLLGDLVSENLGELNSENCSKLNQVVSAKMHTHTSEVCTLPMDPCIGCELPPHASGVLTVPVESRLFHGVARKAFQGRMHGRVWCGKVYSRGNRSCLWVSNVPPRSIPPWKIRTGNRVVSRDPGPCASAVQYSVQLVPASAPAADHCCAEVFRPPHRAHVQSSSGHGPQGC